jgi:hypothetical protein
MTAGSELAAIPVTDLEVEQTIILDWHDRPEEGFLSLVRPASSWYFRLHAERRNEEGLDDCLFTLAPAPEDALRRLTEVLVADHGPPRKHWIPLWQFPSTEAKRQAEEVVDGLIAAAGPPDVVVRSRDLVRLDALWVLVGREQG